MSRTTLLLVTMLLGCGGASSSTEPARGETESGGESETSGEGSRLAATRPWAEMSHEERGAYMADVVLPEMRALFQAHDAERYADFGCATCHGENAHDVNFEMPNRLLPLSHDDIGATFASSEPGAVFMTQTVWPRMAALVGEPPFDPATNEGFRCYDCHAEATAATH